MLDLLPPCSAANLDFDFNFPKGASVGCCWLWVLLVEESPCWKLSNSSFLFGLLLPAFSGMTRLLPSTPKAPRYTIHCTCWLCLYMKKLSSTCREGISCVPFPPTCYFAFRGSNLRGKIKKKKKDSTTSLSAASFLKASLSHIPAASWAGFYEPQVLKCLLQFSHKDWCGAGVNVLLAFLLGSVRQTHFVRLL